MPDPPQAATEMPGSQISAWSRFRDCAGPQLLSAWEGAGARGHSVTLVAMEVPPLGCAKGLQPGNCAPKSDSGIPMKFAAKATLESKANACQA